MCAAGLDAGIRWLLSFCAMSFPFTLMHKIQMPSVVILLQCVCVCVCTCTCLVDDSALCVAQMYSGDG